MKLTAYKIHEYDMRIVPAGHSRHWMSETPQGYARRCLPLRIANQAGWFILNRDPFQAIWDGGLSPESVKITGLSGEPHGVVSHFGSGTVTWILPYLFRTPNGYNLLVRGPANYPMDGVSPLEGIVETDWNPTTFTMSWKITRPDFVVEFSRNQPICMIVPQKRGELEGFEPEETPLSKNPELDRKYQNWAVSRSEFLNDLARGYPHAKKQGWQKDYMLGVTDGERVKEHQTQLNLKPFVKEPYESS